MADEKKLSHKEYKTRLYYQTQLYGTVTELGYEHCKNGFSNKTKELENKFETAFRSYESALGDISDNSADKSFLSDARELFGKIKKNELQGINKANIFSLNNDKTLRMKNDIELTAKKFNSSSVELPDTEMISIYNDLHNANECLKFASKAISNCSLEYVNDRLRDSLKYGDLHHMNSVIANANAIINSIPSRQYIEDMQKFDDLVSKYEESFRKITSGLDKSLRDQFYDAIEGDPEYDFLLNAVEGAMNPKDLEEYKNIRQELLDTCFNLECDEFGDDYVTAEKQAYDSWDEEIENKPNYKPTKTSTLDNLKEELKTQITKEQAERQRRQTELNEKNKKEKEEQERKEKEEKEKQERVLKEKEKLEKPAKEKPQKEHKVKTKKHREKREKKFREKRERKHIHLSSDFHWSKSMTIAFSLMIVCAVFFVLCYTGFISEIGGALQYGANKCLVFHTKWSWTVWAWGLLSKLHGFFMFVLLIIPALAFGILVTLAELIFTIVAAIVVVIVAFILFLLSLVLLASPVITLIANFVLVIVHGRYDHNSATTNIAIVMCFLIAIAFGVCGYTFGNFY